MKPFYVGSHVYGIGKDYETVTRYKGVYEFPAHGL